MQGYVIDHSDETSRYGNGGSFWDDWEPHKLGTNLPEKEVLTGSH